jgi:hypothetical protein
MPRDIILEFIQGTEAWYKSFKRIHDTSKPCPLCGIIPDNMKELADEMDKLD